MVYLPPIKGTRKLHWWGVLQGWTGVSLVHFFFSKASTLCLTQGQLKSLRELHLDNNFLTGEIPRQHGKHGRKQPFWVNKNVRFFLVAESFLLRVKGSYSNELVNWFISPIYRTYPTYPYRGYSYNPFTSSTSRTSLCRLSGERFRRFRHWWESSPHETGEILESYQDDFMVVSLRRKVLTGSQGFAKKTGLAEDESFLFWVV